VIICSGHSRYAIHGFKVDALDFLGKPPNPLEVTEALLKAKKKIDSLHWVKKVVEEDFVVVGDKLGHVHNVVKPTDILYMEQRKKVSIVKLEDGSVFKLAYPFVTSMAKLKSPYMIRVHHSFAVNILKIRTLFAKHCKLVCGEEIPISASFREEVRRIFENKRIN
jgi:DNA-binding LytR/AlgR family response regulator